jgi:predicted transcriptional regulator of viral defense system
MTTETGKQSPDDCLYDIAERQAGYFTTAQAKRVGFTSRQLHYHVSTGRFNRVRWGVYRLSRFPSLPHEDLFVAWLRTGRRGVISHDSAMALYQLSDALPAKIHLTIPRTASRRRDGIVLHTNQLGESDTTMIEGLPVTTVSRTIADAASSGMPAEQVVEAVIQAVDLGLVTAADLLSYARSRGGRPERLISRALEAEVE